MFEASQDNKCTFFPLSLPKEQPHSALRPQHRDRVLPVQPAPSWVIYGPGEDYKDGSLGQSILVLRFEWWVRNEEQNN